MANQLIYIVAKDGTPLMPTKRKRHVEKLIRQKKARILSTVPIIVQLLYDGPKNTQKLVLGPDLGRTNIGLATVNSNGKPVFLAELTTRNAIIKELMQKRKANRMASRRGERKARQRLAKKHHTMFSAGVRMRKLPKCTELVTVRHITNTESRFCNRIRRDGWLTPTANQLLQTFINMVNKTRSFLPITDISIEVNKFSFAKMEDPTIFGTDYQNGPLKGYLNADELVYEQQNGICLLCGKYPIEHYHHVNKKSKRGSESYKNKAGLCNKCHEDVHKNQEADRQLRKLKQGENAKYSGTSILNQVMPFFVKEMLDRFGVDHVHLTNGKETSDVRKILGVVKDKTNQCHVLDAYLIACHAIDCAPYEINKEHVYHIKQYRRHDRALIKAQTERIYQYEGKTVAKNRNKRMDQKEKSLYEFYLENEKLFGKKVAQKIVSNLKVKKSVRRYNNPNRLMPGAEILHNGKRYIVRAQQNNGFYYLAEGYDNNLRLRADECKIVKHNTGLVFVK